MEFEKFKPIPRLSKRWCFITEKIDGTNGCVVIKEITAEEFESPAMFPNALCCVTVDDRYYAVAAQSRNRFVTPEDDNYGFARWVDSSALGLANILGPGHHYGEWWGSGIQRNYGLTRGQRYFSLFNTRRWTDTREAAGFDPIPGLDVVPLLYEGAWSEEAIDEAMNDLADTGSYAQPFYSNPEGIVVFDTLTGQFYKKTFDDTHKGAPK